MLAPCASLVVGEAGVKLRALQPVQGHVNNLLLSWSVVRPEYDIATPLQGKEFGTMLALSELSVECPGKHLVSAFRKALTGSARLCSYCRKCKMFEHDMSTIQRGVWRWGSFP